MALPHRILPLLRHSRQLGAAVQTQIYARCLATAPAPAPAPAPPPLGEVAEDPKNAAPPRLARPIGLQHPPRPGENTGVDTRTWAERREDFGDYDKHLEKRAKLKSEFSKSYFADFVHIDKQHKGKTFIAPPLLFKSSKALFFPNLVGRTLASPDPDQNTTDVLEGRVSVVSVFSTAWAEAQCKTFTDGLPPPPPLEQGVQKVDLNIELNWMKALLVKMFIPSIRKRLPGEQHGRYFIVQRGLENEVRQEMGFLNGRVGYVYLLDWDCRIRWAGSGEATEEEKEALRKGVAKLGGEWKRMEAEGKVGGPEEKKKEEKGFVDDDDDF